MFKDMIGVLRSDLAIDLGTANTLVYAPGKGIILDEPSVIAMLLQGDSMEMLAVGEQAKSMIGRTPDNIRTVRPMQDGVIADFVAAEEMIKQFIKIAIKRVSMTTPRILMCVPASATQVERRAVYDAALMAGAKKIYIMAEPVAAAIGAGLDITQPHGTMVMDIGGGTTDMAVLSLGGVISSHSFRTAGDAMDRAIVDYIRNKHNLLIGTTNAEIIKKEVGTALAAKPDSNSSENSAEANEPDRTSCEPVEIRIKGRNLRSGLPSEIILGPADIAKALKAPLAIIANEARRILEQLPPEIAADIAEEGIHLTGGGALLDNIDIVLEQQTGVTFNTPKDPLRCVVIGAGLALENIDHVGNLLLDVQ